MAERKGESHVILPYEKERFIKDSVEIVRGGDWAKRLDKVIAQAMDTQELSRQSQWVAASLRVANLMLHGLASVRAEQLETKLVPVAVWDGKSGTGLGGTAGTVERWRQLGLQVEVIKLEEILRRERPSVSEPAAAPPTPTSNQASDASSEFAPEIRALLFADG